MCLVRRVVFPHTDECVSFFNVVGGAVESIYVWTYFYLTYLSLICVSCPPIR